MCFEVIRVGFVASFFAVSHRGKSLFDGPVANVQGRMRGRHANAKFQSVVFLNDGGNVRMANHAYTPEQSAKLEVFDVSARFGSVKSLELHQFLG